VATIQRYDAHVALGARRGRLIRTSPCARGILGFKDDRRAILKVKDAGICVNDGEVHGF